LIYYTILQNQLFLLKNTGKNDINMFITGKKAKEHSNILLGVAIQEVLEKSVISVAWEKVI